MESMREAVKTSVKAAVDAGKVSESAQSAPLRMLYAMADAIDAANGDPAIFRTVTPHHFLTYCERLGMLPDGEEAKPAGGRGVLYELKKKRAVND